jgi:hypothetical protein
LWTSSISRNSKKLETTTTLKLDLFASTDERRETYSVGSLRNSYLQHCLLHSEFLSIIPPLQGYSFLIFEQIFSVLDQNWTSLSKNIFLLSRLDVTLSDLTGSL